VTHYGIVGGGKHPENIIEDGLKDIYHDNADHTLYLNCRKGATDSEKRVYTYVLDNTIPFLAVSQDGSAPKVLVETADYLVDGGASAEHTIIKELAANNGTLLVLWDCDNENHMNQLVIKATDLGVKVLELSNGLAPFVVDDETTEEPIITETPAPKAEVELEPLTRDELGDMSVGLLKKAAFAQGIADAGGMSKEELVNVLVEDELPVIASADMVATEIVEPLNVTDGQLTWIEDGVLCSVMLGENFTKRFLADLRYKPN
jgi:hypothetical protein